MIVVGVNPAPRLAGGETPATLRMFAQQTQVTFPIGVDPSKSYRLFPAKNAFSPFPLDVIVDRKGVIRYVNRQYDIDAIERVIEELLAE